MNTTAQTELAPIFATLSTEEIAASIAYQAANEHRSERADASLAAYRAEYAARTQNVAA